MRLFLDIEVYKNYFLALFMNEEGKCKRFEIFNNDKSHFSSQEILKILSHKGVEIVTFNGNNYDLPVLTYALVDPTPANIKRASDRIIIRNVRPWHFYKDEGLVEPSCNHIDLFEVAPGRVSLKLYGGRLNSPRLQELPIEPDAKITAKEVPLLRRYCRNDTWVTKSLFESLEKQINLRRTMTKEYGVDLRSKSDAQIAEAVLKAEYRKITGDNPPKVEPGYESFLYRPPAYLKFSTEPLKEAFETVCTAEMRLDSKTGHVKMPKEVANLKIKIGQSTYKLGIGGLHSQESEIAHYSDEDYALIDRDVASYYPNLMLNMDIEPGGFGEYFKKVYNHILMERMEAKRSGNKTIADSLKITLNGTFGKLANKYSTLYSPENMLRVTLTGQLSLLMLIEALERYGIPVVSANTDGVVIKCPRPKKKALDLIVQKWEERTGLDTEETLYTALYSRDVNNYIAVKEDGEAKAKGVYSPVTLSKNPQNPVCAEAVIRQLTKHVPVEQTVRECQDISKFLTLRTVTGGAVKDDVPLGRAIRWYYAKGESGAIHYATNGNTVPRSEGAKPLMDLPDELPDDIDYDWYIRECEEILMAVGAKERPVVEKIPRKNSKAWKALRDEGKIVENSKGKWEWAQ